MMNPKTGRRVKKKDGKKSWVPGSQAGNNLTYRSWRASSGFLEEIPMAVIVLVIFASEDERIYMVVDAAREG